MLKLQLRMTLYNSKNKDIEFWIDADQTNIEYSKYVLPSAILIHVFAFIGIDLIVNKQEFLLSL